jgi:anti-sigma factor RsiW
MATITNLIGEHDLHAYVDGRLSKRRRKAVEAYLRQHEDAARLVDAYLAQNEALQKFGDAAAPLSASLKVLQSALDRKLTQSRRAWNRSVTKRVSVSPRF